MAPADPPWPHFPGRPSELNHDQDASLKRVLELPVFDRFVFVMSVLERYSDPECVLLLGCSFTDVLRARIRSLQQISRAEKSYPEDSSEAQPYGADARLA